MNNNNPPSTGSSSNENKKRDIEEISQSQRQKGKGDVDKLEPCVCCSDHIQREDGGNVKY